jgi:leucyl aminopeptidase
MALRITLASADALTSADVVALPVFESDLSDPKARLKALKAVDEALGGLLLTAAAEEGFSGKRDQTFMLHTHGKLKANRVLLVGMGARARFEPEALRLAAGHIARRLARVQIKTLAVALSETRNAPACLRALVEGFLLGGYTFTRHQTNSRKDEKSELRELRAVLPEGTEKSRELEDSLKLGERVAHAVNWARDLVNEPANVVTPSHLAEAAVEMAEQNGLKAEVFGRKEIERLKMGMFLGVSQGSAEEPKLIHLEYKPKDAKSQKRPAVALVGKAITFDSGGLSLKTQEGMVDMKTDMAGSAAVFAAMGVVAHLAPPFPVHAFVGSCENMPDGKSYKLGDVLHSRLGKTVEVLNTDAEGRLVLGDILAYANEIKPGVLIDLATLTGACMIALGRHIVGAFGEDDATVWSVQEAAKIAGEELWRLPLTDLQKDQLKSDVADLKNVGERYGGATTAALFLREFVGETPWVHLDIAGPSFANKDRGYILKGGTGVGVRTLIEFIRRRAEDVENPPAAG